MIKATDLQEYVIKPTLKMLDPVIPYSSVAVDLLTMTAGHESLGGTYLHQVGGPAQGMYQMEPDTELDIWENYLEYRDEMAELVYTTLIKSLPNSLCHSLAYATAMARVHYYRVPEPLPNPTSPDYVEQLGEYAKKYYNTEKGKASVTQYVRDYYRFLKA